MKYIDYDANQHNMDRMIEVERQKINHVKMLNTIYKKKSFKLIKQQRQIDKDRSLRINNQLIDKQRKWKVTQKQINHENSLLRNKLLHIYIPKDKEITNNDTLKTNQSLDSIYHDKKFGLNFGQNQESIQSRVKLTTYGSISPISPTNSKKVQTQRQLAQTNSKFFLRLSNIQSDLMPRLKLPQHSKDASYLKQMLMKRSPKKNMRMKKFVQRTISQRQRAQLPLSHSFRESNDYKNSINPEQPFVFY